jgi:hypothetical protein
MGVLAKPPALPHPKSLVVVLDTSGLLGLVSVLPQALPPQTSAPAKAAALNAGAPGLATGCGAGAAGLDWGAERLKTELEAGGDIAAAGGGEVVDEKEGEDRSKRSPIADELDCTGLGWVVTGAAAGAGEAKELNKSCELLEGICC